MKLVAYDVKKLKIYRPCKNQKLILEFLNSDMDCAKVENDTHKSASVAQSNFQGSIKRLGLQNSVMAVRRGNEIFLVRRDAAQ